MNLNPFNRDKDNHISNTFSKSVHTFMLQLQNELKNPKFDSTLKNDSYIIDRFEGDSPIYAVCQNIRTGKMFNIRKNEMPSDIIENSIIKIEDNKYVRDYESEKEYSKKSQHINDEPIKVSNIKWNPILSKDSYRIEEFYEGKIEYAICKNLRTNEKYNILKNELPNNITLGSTIKIINNKFICF